MNAYITNFFRFLAANNAKFDPVAETSNKSDDCNSLAYRPIDFEESVTAGEESADESDARPLAKRWKVNTTGKGKAIPKVVRASPAKRSRRAALRLEETSDEAASEGETPVKPKRKEKPKLRDEINMEAKKLRLTMWRGRHQQDRTGV